MFFTKRNINLLVVFTLIFVLVPNTFVISNQDTKPAERIPLKQSQVEWELIGYSCRGNIINSIVIAPAEYNRTMLLTFAIHGFEDAWDKDGAALVQIAGDIITEFSSHPEELQTTRLIVVPCVNPDGILYGYTTNGLGRCNAQGIDINRDFDYHWQFCDDKRYRTGEIPFSTPEAQSIRNLVLQEKPDIVIDFHGWLNCTYGDEELGDYFHEAFGTEYQGATDKDQVFMQKYFAGWASQYARTIVVEYPKPLNPGNLIDGGYSSHTIDAIKNICEQR